MTSQHAPGSVLQTPRDPPRPQNPEKAASGHAPAPQTSSGQPQVQKAGNATHQPARHQAPSITPQSQTRFDSISDFPEAYRGTDYPSTPRLIANLEYNEFISLKPIDHISIDAAVQHLQSLYSPGKTVRRRQRYALNRLIRYLGRLERSGRWAADVIFKIFQDFDDALFGSTLSGNVSMGWKTEDGTPDIKGIPAVTYGLSDWNRGRGQGVHIALNGNMCLLDAKRTVRDVVEALLHEMIHAYLMVLTGSGRDRTDRYDAEHGLNFRKCVEHMNWAIKAGGPTWIRTSVVRNWAGV